MVTSTRTSGYLDSCIPEPSQCQKIPIYYDDDDDEESSIPLRDIIIYELPLFIAITHSSVEDLVPILSESEGISDDTCDVPFCDNSPPLDALNDHFEIFSDFNNDHTSSDDYSIKDIDYVEASPLDFELVSLQESDTSLFYSDNSLPEFKTFRDHTEETSSSSTTTHTDNTLPEYDLFLFEIEPDQDSDFIPSDDSLKSDLVVSFPSGTRNNIFDPGLFFEVQYKSFLSQNTFSISFIRDLLCPVIESLLPFSSENEDQVFYPGLPRVMKPLMLVVLSFVHSSFTSSASFSSMRTSLTGFPAQSIRSSNAIALDSPYLLVLITKTSQSRQHGKSESDSYYLSE
nr:hypothetical protein [Tanacetum cinerariifolium]